MTVIRKLKLSRRTMLRGAGVSITLPFLDAMVPALARANPRRSLRTMFIFAPNGMKMDEWTPKEVGKAFTLPYLLEPLQPVFDQLQVLSGLALDAARAHGDGPGDHARSAAAFLTCAHPKKTGGTDIRVGVSVDQVLAKSYGHSSRFPSLEVGMEPGRAAGICDSGYSCAYTNHVSWQTETTPVAKETKPQAVFTRLFGDPADHRSATLEAIRRRRRASVLDAVRAEAKSLEHKLGSADRAKLEMYLTAIRDLEQRLHKDAALQAAPPVAVPPSLHQMVGFKQRLLAMYDVLALAFAADQTRVITLMLGNGGSNLSYRFLGHHEGHHSLSHHGKKAENLAGIRAINRFHVECLATFLQTLKSIDDGGQDLLSRSAIVYGSGIGDGDRHNHDDLPVLLLGSGDGAFRGGRHLRFKRNTPIANLYQTILETAGHQGLFGDTTGPLKL